MTNHMVDWAYPANHLPQGADGTAVYIGGKGATHIWTMEETRPFKSVRKLPIYVPAAVGDPIADAFDCLRCLYDFGVPSGHSVAVDMELRPTDNAYFQSFVAVLRWARYFHLAYGSTSTLFDIDAEGYWVAWPNPDGAEFDHPRVRMTQYTENRAAGHTEADWSVVKEWTWLYHMTTNWKNI